MCRSPGARRVVPGYWPEALAGRRRFVAARGWSTREVPTKGGQRPFGSSRDGLLEGCDANTLHDGRFSESRFHGGDAVAQLKHLFALQEALDSPCFHGG